MNIQTVSGFENPMLIYPNPTLGLQAVFHRGSFYILPQVLYFSKHKKPPVSGWLFNFKNSLL